MTEKPDIVARLREHSNDEWVDFTILVEAADEIERLREKLHRATFREDMGR